MKDNRKVLITFALISAISFGVTSCSRPNGNPTGATSPQSQQVQPDQDKLPQVQQGQQPEGGIPVK